MFLIESILIRRQNDHDHELVDGQAIDIARLAVHFFFVMLV